MFKTSPGLVEVTDLQFKLQCRLSIFNNEHNSKISNNSASLLTCASRYGLIFVGTTSNNFLAIQSNIILNYASKKENILNFPRRTIQIPSIPTHLAVNCDHTILAVVIEKDQCPVVIFYDVLSFLKKNCTILNEIRLSATANTAVTEINWNPSIPNIFTACKSDGSLGVYELKQNSVDIKEIPGASGATCFCWSPKGKQIAVGSKDGKITQYKPDLKAVKMINTPIMEGSVKLVNLLWVSNYQFIGIYQKIQDLTCYTIVVDAPKTGDPTFTNYYDICYSGSLRPTQFYVILQPNWNFLMVASANSTELAVLGQNNEIWTQLSLLDEARVELPLSLDHQETFPVGLTFDTSSTTSLPWEDSTIPPCPFLLILSHQGVLCCYNVVYLKQGIPSVCTPPDRISDLSGLEYFTAGSTINESKNVVVTTTSSPSGAFQFNSGDNLKTGLGSPPPPSSVSKPAPSIIQQSTPLVAEKNAAPQFKSLFGSKVSITPIKPQHQAPPNQLFGGPAQSVNKNSIPASSTSSVAQQSQGNSHSSTTMFSAPKVNNSMPVKPLAVSNNGNNSTNQLKTQEKLNDGNLAVNNANHPLVQEQQEEIKTKKITSFEVNAVLLSQMVLDEKMCLEAEIKQLIKMASTLTSNLGTDKEIIDAMQKIESLDKFTKDAVEISKGQSGEVHSLKQNLIQSWAWYEEAKSHYDAANNKVVNLLIEMQPLDSLAEKRQKEIDQLVYYVESQLSQVNKALDEQWENFQDYTKKTYKIKTPTMETIFQTMVKQNVIQQKQTYVLKDISARLKKRSNSNKSKLLLQNKDLLVDDFQALSLNPQDMLKFQYEKVKQFSNRLTETKSEKLRTLLNQREVTQVKTIKPLVSSFTINQSASKMRDYISKLGPSANSSNNVARTLDFSQSSPASSFQLSKNDTALSFSENVAVTSSSSSSNFVPLIKSGPVISNSQGSAFTPIGTSSSSFQFTNNEQLPRIKSISSFGGFPLANSTTISQVKPFSSASTLPFQSVPSSSSSAVNKNVQEVKSDSAIRPAQYSSASASAASNLRGILSTESNVTTVAAKPSTQQINAASAFKGTYRIPNEAAAVAKPILNTVNESSELFFKKVSEPLALQTQVGLSKFTPSSSSSEAPTIFDNLQSVIDKVTNSLSASSTTSVTKSVSAAPPAATTTQSIFGGSVSATVSSTASTPLFGFGSTTSSSFFGNASKTPPTTAPTTQNIIFGSSKDDVLSQPLLLTPPLSAENGSPIKKEVKPITIISEATVAQSDEASIPAQQFGAKLSHNAVAADSVSLQDKPNSINVVNVTEITSTPTTSSIFGTPSTTAAASGFKISVAASPFGNTSTQNNIFVSTSSPAAAAAATLFGSTTPSTPVTTTTFASNATVSTASPLFGAVNATSSSASVFPTAASTSPSFVQATNTSNTSSMFGASSGNKFGLATTTTPVSATTAATNSNIFASAVSSSPSPATTNVVVSAFSSPPITANIFGTPSSSVSSAPPAFGTTNSNIFGAISSTAASSPPSSVFGASASPSLKPVANIFAAAASPTSTSSNIFGTAATTSSTASSFGSIFSGSPKTSTTTTNNNNNSPFGGQPASFGNQSIFASSPPVSTPTNSSVFGQSAVISSPFGSGSVFGGSTPSSASTNTGTVFGSSASSNNNTGFASSNNIFGSNTANQSAPAVGSFGFGGLSVGGGGGSSSVFGGSPSGNVFGQPAPNANPFGKVEINKPSTFGSSSSSIFGTPSSTTANNNNNAFGNTSSTQNSIFGSNNTSSTFGGGFSNNSSTFGGNPSVFGQSPSGGFGTSSRSFGGGSASSAGPFSGSSSSAAPVAQSGFGAAASFQKSSGFGAAPSFGGALAAPPAFGSAATFGGAPIFGSASSSTTATFGSSSSASPPSASNNNNNNLGFGASQQNSGFGSLASQNSVGFGNLAQQQTNNNTSTTSMPFSGGSSFSSWR